MAKKINSKAQNKLDSKKLKAKQKAETKLQKSMKPKLDPGTSRLMLYPYWYRDLSESYHNTGKFYDKIERKADRINKRLQD